MFLIFSAIQAVFRVKVHKNNIQQAIYSTNPPRYGNKPKTAHHRETINTTSTNTQYGEFAGMKEQTR